MSVDMWLPFFLVILARIVNNSIDIRGGNWMKFHSIFRIKQLESLITEYAQKYYQDGSSPVSDEEFDSLVNELRSLKPDSSILSATGWGYDVNNDTTPGQKAVHMYGKVEGLNKCHNAQELSRSYLNTIVDASLKLDGLSVVLYYKEGQLKQALTRGDGVTGIDVTKKVTIIDPALSSTMSDIQFSGAVRGEILMSHANFEKYKRNHDDAKNARNTTAGLINAKEFEESDLKLLSILVYTVVGLDTSSEFIHSKFLNMTHIVNWLKQNFKAVAPYSKIFVKCENFQSTMDLLRQEWYGEFPADGIVLTQNISLVPDFSPEYDGIMSSTTLRYKVDYESCAFKFPAESKNTEVLDVEWNLTKTHYLMPKVKLSPIFLSGTQVSYCTGYNAQFIQQKGIGPGAIVEVEKRGEIIPNINKVVLYSKCDLPQTCPDCQSTLIWDGVHLKCPNKNCGNASKQDLLIWIRNIAPIDGLGDSIIIKYLSAIFEDNLDIDTIMLSQTYSEIVRRLQRSSGDKHKKLIVQMFDKLYGRNGYQISLKAALLALNIPRLGEVTADKFAKYPDSIRCLMTPNMMSSSFWDDLAAQIGYANAIAIKENQSKFRRLEYISDMIVWSEPTNTDPGKTIKVAITGKLSVPRAAFVTELARYGYKVGEISSSTKFLITDDPNSNSSKNVKANKLNILKITESEFRSKYLNK